MGPRTGMQTGCWIYNHHLTGASQISCREYFYKLYVINTEGNGFQKGVDEAGVMKQIPQFYELHTTIIVARSAQMGNQECAF